MNRYQAQWIQNHYQGVPSLRPDQEDLIRYVYPAGKVRGGKPLPECKDDQVYRVAERLYRKALELNGQPVPPPRPRQLKYDPDPPSRAQVQRDWTNRLYEMFNIPSEQRHSDHHLWVNPADLEAILLE